MSVFSSFRTLMEGFLRSPCLFCFDKKCCKTIQNSQPLYIYAPYLAALNIYFCKIPWTNLKVIVVLQGTTASSTSFILNNYFQFEILLVLYCTDTTRKQIQMLQDFYSELSNKKTIWEAFWFSCSKRQRVKLLSCWMLLLHQPS